MDYHDSWSGIKFGMAGLTELLGSSRSAILSSDGCEDLYNKARTVTLQLIRCDRSLDELELWKGGFSRISALARGSHTSDIHKQATVDGDSDYLLLLASRFETLEELLANQFAWKTHYGLASALDLPFIRATLLFLSDKGSVKMEDYFAGVGTNNTSCVSILAPLRLLSWAEEQGGTYVWLTRTGKLLAIDLETETGLRTEATQKE
jgi:hypothetical protein